MKKPEKIKVDGMVDDADGKPLTDADGRPQPPPEEDQGGGDLCSPERQPPTDDDTPLT